MTAPTLCVLGSVNLDLIVQTKTLPRAGETVTNGRYSALPGGKGGNVALAAKRLGANVTLQAAIGHDDYADQALRFLRAEKVNLSDLILMEGQHTGLAFINVSDDGENQIAVASGANAAFAPENLNPITAPALFTQFEISVSVIEAALEGFNGFVSLNASPVTSGAETVISRADLIIVNEGEYEAYSDTLATYEGLLAITLGGAGAKLLQKGKVLAESSPPKIDVIDTTGAGDSFAAALTVALLEGQTHQSALDFACVVGALTTTKVGTQSAAPSRAEVTALQAVL